MHLPAASCTVVRACAPTPPMGGGATLTSTWLALAAARPATAALCRCYCGASRLASGPSTRLPARPVHQARCPPGCSAAAVKFSGGTQGTGRACAGRSAQLRQRSLERSCGARGLVRRRGAPTVQGRGAPVVSPRTARRRTSLPSVDGCGCIWRLVEGRGRLEIFGPRWAT